MSPLKYKRLPQSDSDLFNDYTYNKQGNVLDVGFSSKLDKEEGYFSYDDKKLKRNHESSGNGILAGSIGNFGSRLAESVVLIVSYALVIVTLPFSLFFCLKFTQNFEKIVTFRLGKLKKAHGPGLIIILPCVDHIQRVDMRAKTFDVSAMQVLTADGGIIHLACTVEYGVRDAIASVTQVRNAHQSMQNLVQSVVYCAVNKRPVTAVIDDRKQFMESIIAELAKATFPWGLEVLRLDITDVKVMKEANPPFSDTFSSMIPGLSDLINKKVQRINNNEQFASVSDCVTDSKLDVYALDGTFDSVESDLKPNVLLERLIRMVSPILTADLVKTIDARFTFDIQDVGCLFLDLKDGCGSIRKISSLDETSFLSDAVIGLKLGLLFGILAGQINPLTVYANGQLHVDGDRIAAARLKELGNTLGKHYWEAKKKAELST